MHKGAGRKGIRTRGKDAHTAVKGRVNKGEVTGRGETHHEIRTHVEKKRKKWKERKRRDGVDRQERRGRVEKKKRKGEKHE